MKMEAETGVMFPQAKEHLESPGAGRDRKDPPWAFGCSVAQLTCSFQTSALQNHERTNFGCF